MVQADPNHFLEPPVSIACKKHPQGPCVPQIPRFIEEKSMA